MTLLEHPGLPWNYGQARGGSQFFEAPNGKWWAFFHSSDSKQYYAGLVEVDPESMIPLRMTHEPLLPDEMYPLGWNGYPVLWVAGAVIIGDEVLISFGINDDSCHLRLLPIADLEAALLPLDAVSEPTVRMLEEKPAVDHGANGDITLLQTAPAELSQLAAVLQCKSPPETHDSFDSQSPW